MATERDLTVSSEEREEAAASRRQVYALVGLFMVSVLVIAVVLAILSAGFAGGGTWWQRIAISHTPITNAVLGQDLVISARVTGWPKNVTLNYLVIPNNSTVSTFHDVEWTTAFLLLVSAGGDQYSYTIAGSEVQGDVSYYIVAMDAYGNAAAVPTTRIRIADFAVEIAAKEMAVYSSKSAKTTVTVRSYNDFSSSVRLRAVAGGLDTLPGGLIAEFNPAAVTPPKGGAATAELTVRSTSKEYVPSGNYYMSVEGLASTPRGTMVRNASVILLKVPDFDFDVTPSSQSVTRMVIGEIVERITPFNITLKITEGFESDLAFRVAGLPVTGVDYRWVIAGAKFNTTGTTTVTLQIITRSTAQIGTYTLTIYVSGGGLEKFKQVTFNIYETTQTR